MENPPLLFSFKHVHYAYPIQREEGHAEQTVEALSDISFDIRPSEHVAILGPNGSGKSTLAKLMTGLLNPSSGEVTLLGRPISTYVEQADLPRYVGMVFQDPDVQSVATVVEEDVAFALENMRMPIDEMHKRVEDALKRVNMWAYRTREPHALSGGQKQRVAIATVIAPEPTCILFDEATSMLDSIGRQEVHRLMDDLRQAGHTIISITHRMDEAILADRVLVLDAGRLVMDVPPGELFRDADRLKRLHLDMPIQAVAAKLLRDNGQGDVPSVIDTKQFATYVGETAQRTTTGTVAEETIRPASYTLDGTDDLRAVPADAQTAVEDVGADDEVIRVDRLNHVYSQGTPMETQALIDVSLSVRRGEIVSIVGATGSGKSTFSLYLNGLYQADKGTVQVLNMDGAERKTAKRLRKSVGMLFQKSDAQIFEALIGDEIAFGPFRFGATVEEARQAVKDAMDWVGLDFAWRDRPTYALSGGQRRKVAFASVLAAQPEILVLDEPTAALDPLARRDLLDVLRRLRKERGMTIVFITHQLEEVVELADRVVVFHQGRVVADTTPRAWLSDPATVRHLGFTLPEGPAFVEGVCRALNWPLPTPMPLRQEEAAAWLRTLLNDRKRGEGNHGQL
ncbi:ABC transporter ATP-binding protein [Alicyclobacillus dauci]|uniref:Energy-coupling factor transporter ATPase n=1 Tax=Alicyclobacillus dauci TaxID=1475485 RepID=A0ABY6Z0W5_9BACL|nr:energy-coupling factor transporter ATPase [Alicyclobacillus dauci]WAH35876.1 energy-coupling factor transporter ATPase [Alicyclobacillus dauci]